MKRATISEKGQITLPSEIRRKVKLRPGMQVQVEIRDDEIVLHPVKSLLDLAGIFADRVGIIHVSEETIQEIIGSAIAEEVFDEGRS